MQPPQTSPKGDPVALWALQLHLLSLAEAALGARDASKKIYQRHSQTMVPTYETRRDSTARSQS